MNPKLLIMLPVIAVILLIGFATAAYFEPLDIITGHNEVDYSDMVIQGNYMGLAREGDNGYGLEMIDFSDPETLISAGQRSFEHYVYNPDWEGNYFYIAGGTFVPGETSLVYIYDVSDFQHMVLASQITLSYHYTNCVRSRGIYAIVGCDWNGGDGGLYTLSVADPYNPYVIWSCDTIGACDIILGHTFAYAFTWCNEIKILDISRMDSPVQLTHFYCSEVDAIDVDESRHLLYATCFDQGLLIYNISNPANPTLLSTTPMPEPGSFAVDICHSKINRQFLFIAAYYSPLLAFDTSDPLHPVVTARYNMPQGYSTNVCSHGDLVFADNHYSIVSLRFHPEGEAVDENPGLADRISLSQNYPNPFNQSTIISYSLPESRNMRLEIYDALGRKVSTLFDGYQQAGEKEFSWDASSLSSGTYFYKLTAPEFSVTRKMTLLK